MKKYEVKKQKQLELFEKGSSLQKPAKRINIVSLKLVKESSILYKKRRVTSPEDAYHLMKELLVDCDRERFVVVCLDTKNQPTDINICHVGSLNASIVHPREVMKAAILANSASIILFHNHPSQDPTPSNEDLEVTKRLAEAGEIIGIDVLDHLIVCEEKFVSLKEKGYL
ncbi:JAB domain-containing protein [Peribacillus acanthi]|uniref:JAB domain-containing protein n=1 Tax=Peribacillus acanthi TaxID=2171554 RepID=UPI000D3E5D34|nr:DNA repair protein RadC [Peribacillus acanthi]